MLKFKSFDDAYKGLLSKLIYAPDFINSPRGNFTRECLNASFCIENPCNRICYLFKRKTNIFFNFAEIFWYLSGEDSLDFINYYCKNMNKYSMNGINLTGSAYGPKIFRFGKNKVNQWEKIINLLSKDDPFSNRAIVQIFDPNENLDKNNLDVSCTIALQFFLRNQKLYLSSYMRSNDCYRGMISDIFSFTFFQELLATYLEVDLGTYFHNVGTLHLYQTDYSKAFSLLTESNSNESNISFFPKMPKGNNWKYIEKILEWEKKLRKYEAKLNFSAISDLSLSDYWEQILILFGIYQGIVYENSLNFQLFEKLNNGYQFLIKNKWPELFFSLKKHSLDVA